MATAPDQAYPRPDFTRTALRWQSLNGPWDFLFDDEDVGMSAGWQRSSLPAEVELKGLNNASTQQKTESKSESITAKIAAGTQDLVKNNIFTNKDLKKNQKRTIKVPFVFQCPDSGIHEGGVHEVLWYERSFSDPRSAADRTKGDRVLLRFGAVDYHATVWVSGQFVGQHRGGHVPFDIDITDALAARSESEPHRLTLRVYDSAYDLTQPRGKQYWGAKPESIFYTPSGGIWQSVWLETVPTARIADSSHGTIIRSNDIDAGQLHAQIAVSGRPAANSYSVQLEASIGGVSVGTSDKTELPKDKDSASLTFNMRLPESSQSALPSNIIRDAPLHDQSCWHNGVALWSPEHPLLYDLTIRLFDASGNAVDEVETTTGMRSLDWHNDKNSLLLNGRPYFQALVLDQGYWPSSFMTPPSPEHLADDIKLSKAMGFNGCRKHQKVEDPIFLYHADRLGYLVWGEMANAYEFSNEYVDRFNQEWIESVKRDINHPSIVTWTPVNESWGYTDLKTDIEQRNHIRSLYYMTKTLDPTRPINDNCGWEHVCTDLTTFHDYADGPELAKTCTTMAGILGPKAGRDLFVPATGLDLGHQPRPGAPVICTEFGGVNIAPAKGTAGGDRDWGYTTASDPADLLTRIEKLMRGVVDGGLCSGFVYTQLADIEQEVNGLYSFDRKEKLEASKVKAVMDEAQKVFYSSRR